MTKRNLSLILPLALGGLLIAAFLVGCGGASNRSLRDNTGSATLTISDPPTCKVPVGDFIRVWVTVTRVRAHISSDAGPNDSGWVDLVDLRDNPKQIDLLNIADTTCTLATLGSTSGLPPGDYQQIRLHLLSNNPGSGEATPSPNACGANGFNCAELPGGNITMLLLSSEDRTGIKIPPGRVAGGAIKIEAGQTADINIDFSACDSVVRQGDGQFRLKPTLHAGEVSLTTDSISGRVVDNTSGNPVANAAVYVLAEQPDADGIDRVIMARLASATAGTFTLCPLPTGNYDIVVAALSEAGVAYNATITFDVPSGTAMGDIRLAPETGTSTAPGEIRGQVTTAGTGGATGADIALAALQEASAKLVTIPLFEGSTANFPTESPIPPATCPDGTRCAGYRLFVPASNPMVGTYTTSGTVYSPPALGDIFYRVNARAYVPGSGGLPNCTAPSLTTDKDNADNPLKVTAGTFVTAETLAFTGCTEVY